MNEGRYYHCERCRRAIDRNSFLTLSLDRRYRQDCFFIFHINCAIAETSKGRRFHIHLRQSNLALVERVWE